MGVMCRRRLRARRLASRAVALAVLVGARAFGQTFTTDASVAGTWFNPGVRGQAIPAIATTRGDWPTGINGALAVAKGSSLRGVAGGLEADTYNWKTSNNQPREGTLNYLRYSRDYNADLYITANIRGLVEPDPNTPGSQRFYDTTIPTLASLAADQVRYTNHIVQTYRQGQAITDPRDQAILNSLNWATSSGGQFDKLLTSTEAMTPKVKYWEIGNEPRVGLSSSYKVTNSYTFLAPPRSADSTHMTDYAQRYAALTSAMLAEDPTIQVGPAMQWLSAVTEQEILTSILQRQPDGSLLPVNFIGYHPYQKLADQVTTADKEAYLRGVYDDHLSKITGIKNIIAASGRDPNSIALVASEQNVSNYTANETPNEANMAHALGCVETVFSFARLGLQGAHYWIWPTHAWDGTKYPSDLADEKLRDHMGDTLLNVSASNTDNLHLYSTRDSKSGETDVWGLNFSDATDITRAVALTHVGGRGHVTLYRLGALSGATSLGSSNLASDMSGGPTHNVDWTTTDLTGQRLDNLSVTFKSAQVTLVSIEKWRQFSLPGDANADGKVDSADITLVNANMNGDEKNWWQGDVTGDGLVTSADLGIANANNGVQLGTKWIKEAGTWTTTSNWQGSVVPNAIGANAYLGSSITAARSLTVGSAVTLGMLVYDNVNAYDLSGSGSLKTQVSSGSARVYVIQGSQKVSVPWTLASDTIVDVAAGASLTLGGVTINAAKTLTRSGAGTLTITGTQSHSAGSLMQINGGTLNLNSNAGSATAANLTLNVNAAANLNALQNLGALNIGTGGRVNITTGATAGTKTKSLTIATSGKLDVGSGRAIIDYGSASAIGAWNGSAYSGITGMVTAGQIMSSTASTASAPTTIAMAEASSVLHLTGTQTATWAGQTVDATSVLLMNTWTGDADLSGTIDGDDYFQIDSGYVAHDTGYARGDFNFDGKINADDYFIIDKSYAKRLGMLGAAPLAGLTVVPEPGSGCAMIAMAGAGLMLRRRRDSAAAARALFLQ